MTDDMPLSESGESGTDYELQQLRLLFFRALDKFCPAARDELHKLWVACREDFEQVKQKMWQVDASQANEVDNSLARSRLQKYDPDPRISILLPLLDHRRGCPVPPEIVEVNAKVDERASDNRIMCDWVLDAACRLLAAWDDNPPEDYSKPPWLVVATGFYDIGIAGPFSREDCEFNFRVPMAWHPFLGSVADAKERVTNDFKDYFDWWFEDRLAIAEKGGCQEISQRHRGAERDLEWLIRLRIKKQPIHEVYRDHSPGVDYERTITIAVERITTTLGLPSATDERAENDSS